jgi:hypothetical protein
LGSFYGPDPSPEAAVAVSAPSESTAAGFFQQQQGVVRVLSVAAWVGNVSVTALPASTVLVGSQVFGRLGSTLAAANVRLNVILQSIFFLN